MINETRQSLLEGGTHHESIERKQYLVVALNNHLPDATLAVSLEDHKFKEILV